MKKRLIAVILVLLMFTAVAIPANAIGDAKIVAAPIGKVEIDGEIDDVWSMVEAIPVTNLKAGSYMNTANPDPETYASLNCKVLWDGFNILYILFIVKDRVICTDAANQWEQDSVEFYIDEDCSNGTSYDGNDAQFRIIATEGIVKNAYNNVPKSVVKMTDDGYIIETAYWFSKVNPKEDNAIGFDLQLNDDAEGNGTRNACLGWSDETDVGATNPSVWGNLVFSGTVVGETKAAAETVAPMPKATKPAELLDLTGLAEPNAVTYETNDDGSVVITFKDNPDPFITINVSTIMEVMAEDYPYFALYLKTNDYVSGQMFYCTAGGVSGWDEPHSTTFEYYEVEGNQVVVVDFEGLDGWEGDIFKLRFDMYSGGPSDYENASITLYAAAFFKDYDDAENFKVEGFNVELDPELTTSDKTDAPKTDAPETNAPETDASSAEAPTTDSVTTKASVTTKGTQGEVKSDNKVVLIIICSVVFVAVIVVAVVLIVKRNKR